MSSLPNRHKIHQPPVGPFEVCEMWAVLCGERMREVCHTEGEAASHAAGLARRYEMHSWSIAKVCVSVLHGTRRAVDP